MTGTVHLPLRNHNGECPNNRCVAVQRATNLKRKLGNNPQFCDDYIKFMTDILDTD